MSINKRYPVGTKVVVAYDYHGKRYSFPGTVTDQHPLLPPVKGRTVTHWVTDTRYGVVENVYTTDTITPLTPEPDGFPVGTRVKVEMETEFVNDTRDEFGHIAAGPILPPTNPDDEMMDGFIITDDGEEFYYYRWEVTVIP